ncbi:MAG: DUF1329 domain-containing protein [Desulfatitalea sp.]|nr:DUF1329 domain-containing protein [Desulfatitalea sp.]NNK02772.1 DUF1329 domain-containing protein [Desulfatitalea sp.]
MKSIKIICIHLFIFCLAAFAAAPAAISAEKVAIDWPTYNKQKSLFDDPTPVMKTFWTKDVLPPDMYAKFVYDIPTMRAKWAELVGFKAPDIVGKIAPEIKPGKYTHQDKAKYQGLKELMIPLQYEMFFGPAATPLGADFSEFELVPTQQYYWRLPLAQASLQNMGKTKQDAQGFIIAESYNTGIPFPQPSGSERFKVMQLLYNNNYRPLTWDAMYSLSMNAMYDRNFKESFGGRSIAYVLQLAGRSNAEPKPFYDERAKSRNEFQMSAGLSINPRDAYGNVILVLMKLGIEPNEMFMYSGAMRRIRKLTGTDTQDTGPGSNSIMDDAGGFRRPLSPTLFPYEYKLVADREYLAFSYTTDGKEYIQSSNMEFKNVRMERRPMYVIELIQQDPSYVYGKTVMYMDKETFQLMWIENYDQKGRLFRGFGFYPFFDAPMGIIGGFMMANWNFQTPQTGIMHSAVPVPAPWLTREFFSFSNLAKMGK